MPSFLKDYGWTWIHKFCGDLIRQGPMPCHIGIIPDGNRRYIKDKNMESAADGIRKGVEKISQVCKMMVDLGIPEVTMYFFSLENFNRTPAEVDGIMKIFTEMMHRLVGDLANLEKAGYGVEVIGDYRKANTPTLKNLFAKVMWKTRNNTNFRLHIAFAYGGQDEISSRLELLKTGIVKGDLMQDNIHENRLDPLFALVPSNPPDIIVRTGGDRRISDFMTWRGSDAYLEFLHTIKWPEFTYWALLKVIFCYQMQVTYCGLLQNNNKGYEAIKSDAEISGYDNNSFITKWRRAMWKVINEDSDRI